MSRADAIRKIIEKRPDDPFPRYGLAMELKNSGARDEAKVAFEELEQRFAEYVPQYLMHANLLVELGLRDGAKEVLRRGIPVAQKKGEGHAAGEMEQALSSLD